VVANGMWCVVEVLLLVHHSTTIYTQWNNDGNSLPCLSFSESTWTSIPDQLSALPRTVTEGDDHSLTAVETTTVAWWELWWTTRSVMWDGSAAPGASFHNNNNTNKVQ